MDHYKGALSAGLALGLLALQFGTIAFAGHDLAVRIVLPATLGAVPLALWAYRDRIGVWVIFIGLAANLAATLANGGLMPIERNTVVEAVGAERAATYETGRWIPGSKDVLVADGGGRLLALGDSIIVRIGGGGMAVSPGDLVVWSGLIILAAEASLAWQRRTRAVEAPQREGERAAEGGATT